MKCQANGIALEWAAWLVQLSYERLKGSHGYLAAGVGLLDVVVPGAKLVGWPCNGQVASGDFPTKDNLDLG